MHVDYPQRSSLIQFIPKFFFFASSSFLSLALLCLFVIDSRITFTTTLLLPSVGRQSLLSYNNRRLHINFASNFYRSFKISKPISVTMSKRPNSASGSTNKKAKANDNNDHEEQYDDVGESSASTSIAGTIPHIPTGFHVSRARTLTKNHRGHQTLKGECVVLWMSRDQRVRDNYALLYAQSVAQSLQVPLKVVFNLVPRFLEATLRQYAFMIGGLKEVETELRSLEIPFHLLMGDPVDNVSNFVKDQDAAMLVTDFSPLRVSTSWVQAVATRLDQASGQARTVVPMIQVDAHNIVPCWVASPKLEYSARTFRGKITPKIPEYLKDIPSPLQNPAGSLAGCTAIDWDAALESLQINRDVKEVTWIRPGATAAESMLTKFIEQGLKGYDEKRNDPNNLNASSNMSPYLHFGQISAQRVALAAKRAKQGAGSATDSFIEELVVRRELTDNFCFYNPHYDSIEGCYEWAKDTLSDHSRDPRSHIYTREQFERGQTHDDLWNAAQLQMVQEGKMHGFLRMYWAKKILEWTRSPEEALAYAIYLNDKYELDGRDPNGYVGCMWSIGGIHDQGWGERPVFGKIRFMNYEGCKRKFDVKKFVARYPPAAKNAVAVTGQRTLI